MKRKARKFKRVFRPKTGGLQKKEEKKIFTKIETDFPAKIGNSNVFSAQKQVVSKKKKKKEKRSSPKLRLIFRPKSEILTHFQAESRHVLHNFGTQFLLGGGGAVLSFSPKNRPQKHQKRAILHTSLANGGGVDSILLESSVDPAFQRYAISNSK